MNDKEKALAVASKYLDTFSKESKKQGFEILERTKQYSQDDVVKMLLGSRRFPTVTGWLLTKKETKFYFSDTLLNLTEEEDLLLKRTTFFLFAMTLQKLGESEIFHEVFLPHIHNALISDLGLLVQLFDEGGELGFSIEPSGLVVDELLLKVPVEELEPSTVH